VLQTVEVNTKEEEEGTMTCDVGNQGPRWNRHTHVVGLNRLMRFSLSLLITGSPTPLPHKHTMENLYRLV
jgi:hypothetical protein